MKTLASIGFVVIFFMGCHRKKVPLNVPVDTIPSKIIDGAVVYGDTAKIKYNDLAQTDKNNYILTIKLKNAEKDNCSVPAKIRYTTTTTLENKSNDTLTYVDWTCSHAIWVTNSKFRFAYDMENYSCGNCDNNMFAPFIVPPNGKKIIDLAITVAEKGEAQPTTFRIGMVLERVFKPNDFKFYAGKFETHQGNLQAQTQNIIWSNEITVP